MASDEYKFRAILGKIIVACWVDDKFLASLARNPKQVLASCGLHPPPHVNISIHVDTGVLRHVLANPEWIKKQGSDILKKFSLTPRDALKSVGYSINQDLEYKVVFNSTTHMNIIIPISPTYYECSIERIR